MADYKKLYFEMFNDITNIIENLKEIQQKAEEHYIEIKNKETNP